MHEFPPNEPDSSRVSFESRYLHQTLVRRFRLQLVCGVQCGCFVLHALCTAVRLGRLTRLQS